MGKFSSIQDVLNGFILDGILGNYKEGELPLMHQNLSNIENIIIPEKSIFTFDRNYNAMELYARIIEMNSYFIVRLKDTSYKKERSKITSNDSPIVNPTIFHNHICVFVPSRTWEMFIINGSENYLMKCSL